MGATSQTGPRPHLSLDVGFKVAQFGQLRSRSLNGLVEHREHVLRHVGFCLEANELPDLESEDIREALQFAAEAVREKDFPSRPRMRFLVDSRLFPGVAIRDRGAAP